MLFFSRTGSLMALNVVPQVVVVGMAEEWWNKGKKIKERGKSLKSAPNHVWMNTELFFP